MREGYLAQISEALHKMSCSSPCKELCFQGRFLVEIFSHMQFLSCRCEVGSIMRSSLISSIIVGDVFFVYLPGDREGFLTPRLKPLFSAEHQNEHTAFPLLFHWPISDHIYCVHNRALRRSKTAVLAGKAGASP
jgi:hypothetical protein